MKAVLGLTCGTECTVAHRLHRGTVNRRLSCPGTVTVQHGNQMLQRPKQLCREDHHDDSDVPYHTSRLPVAALVNRTLGSTPMGSEQHVATTGSGCNSEPPTNESLEDECGTLRLRFVKNPGVPLLR